MTVVLTSSRVGALVEGSIVNGFKGVDATPVGADTPSSGKFTTLEGTTHGFYGQAAVAKPTGVAVTEIGIHAALVTLNLIAGP